MPDTLEHEPHDTLEDLERRWLEAGRTLRRLDPDRYRRICDVLRVSIERGLSIDEVTELVAVARRAS